MSDDSIPSEQGAEGTLKHLLTDEYRLAQAAHLDLIITPLWDQGVLAEYRAWASFQDIHARLRVLHEDLMAEVRAAGNLNPVVRGDNFFDTYVGLVLAMARAGDPRPFVPVDLWPYVPPLHPYTREARMGLQAILNLARERVGLFTERKLLLNRHYALLLAHLLVCHEEIRHACHIPPPYPWPFVIRLDSEETPSLDVQPDIRRPLPDLARSLAGALHSSLRQAGPTPYGALAKTPGAQDASAPRKRKGLRPGRSHVAQVADRLMKLYPDLTLSAIRLHPLFEQAQIEGGTFIGTDSALVKLMTQYYHEQGKTWSKRRGSVR